VDIIRAATNNTLVVYSANFEAQCDESYPSAKCLASDGLSFAWVATGNGEKQKSLIRVIHVHVFLSILLKQSDFV
jgi:hypothetical protein